MTLNMSIASVCSVVNAEYYTMEPIVDLDRLVELFDCVPMCADHIHFVAYPL